MLATEQGLKTLQLVDGSQWRLKSLGPDLKTIAAPRRRPRNHHNNDVSPRWAGREVGYTARTVHSEYMTAGYQNSSVIMGGKRDGEVVFWDERVGDKVIRMRHGSAVSGLWMVDGIGGTGVGVRGLHEVSQVNIVYVVDSPLDIQSLCYL